MAQFVELFGPGGTSVFLRCGQIERLETDNNFPAGQIASPEAPIRVVLRESKTTLLAYGCSVLDILHAIHRDDVFLDSREPS